MAKNRVWTDAWREVKNTKSRFLSLFLLSALAVAFLSGLRAAAPDMKHSADCYFDASNTMDLHILSTLGLTEDDVAAVGAFDSIETAEGAYTVDAMISLESGDMIVKTLSYRPGGLNRPALVDGRMPEQPNECLLDARLLTDGLKIGDSVTLDPGEDMEGAFRYQEYTIVGLADSPLYISIDRGTTTLGAGRVGAFLLLPEEGYTLDYYTDLYASVEGARSLNSYSDEYEGLMDATTDAMDALGDERADGRYDEVVGEANEKLADAETELRDAEQEAEEKLSDAERELRDARRELDDGWREYYNGKNTFETEIADAQQKIADGEAELTDAYVELGDAKATLNNSETEYESGLFDYQRGLADYERGRTLYEEGLKQYEDGLAEYRSGAAALSAGQAQLRAAAEQLNAAKATLDEQQAGFETLLATVRGALSFYGFSFDTDEALFTALHDPAQGPALFGTLDLLLSGMQAAQPDAGIPGSTAELLAAKQQLDDGWAEYKSGLAQYESGVAQMNAGSAALSSAWTELSNAKKQLDETEAQLADARVELDDAETVMADARIELDDGWTQYEDGLAEYETGKADLEQAKLDLATAITDGEAELADAYQKLTDGEREYRNGLAEFEDAKQEAEEKLSDARRELNDAKRKIAEIEDCKWYILDRNTNIGFVTFGQDGDRMTGLASVFPLIFFLVAALVCLTTMTRMVEEQRVQIGGMKALGYEKGAIALKYVGYGFAAGLLGGIAGLILGVTMIPLIIYNAWCIIYALPPITFLPQPGTAVLSVAAATAVLTLSALAACLSVLTASPAQLMRPKAPPAGKRVLLEYLPALWKRFSFNQKVTVRNLFRYKKRFIMTLAGIAGCTALIVTGFGLRDSIFEIMDIQYDELSHSNVSIAVEDDMTPSEHQELLRVLDGSDAAADYLLCTETSVTAETSRYSLALTVVSAEEPAALERFCTFRERVSHAPVPFGEDSVLLSEKTANMLGVGVGDSLTLVSGDERYEATVTGIIEHYVQHYIYTTDTMYEQIFGEPPAHNSYWVACPDANEETLDALASQLVNLSGVTNLTRITTLRDTMMHSLQSVDYAVVVIIISAAALAFVVLYNLTNINITERMRELATLKVLGFYDRELSSYVYRENIILTILGAVIGLFLGKALLMYLIGTVEVDMVMFGRQIKPMSYLLGAVLTALFSLLVNLAAHRKLKQLDMVESLKTVE